jgi:hypothetical protein
VITLLASHCDVLGNRLATGLNSTVLGEATEHWQEDGYLIDASGNYFITSAGDRLVYTQFP